MEIKNLEDAKDFGSKIVLIANQIECIRALIEKIKKRSPNSVSTFRVYYGQNGDRALEFSLRYEYERLLVVKGLQAMLDEYKLQLNTVLGRDICDI